MNPLLLKKQHLLLFSNEKKSELSSGLQMGYLRRAYHEESFLRIEPKEEERSSLKVVYKRDFEAEKRCAGFERYGYQSKESLDEEGLDTYDFHARYYDPALGRFTTVDPQHQFMSGYVGMGNNPVMMVDPDGELAWFIPLIVGAVVNVATNWNAISSAGSFGEGLAMFGGFAVVGAASGAATLIGGPAGFALAGAVNGFGNGLMYGQSGTDLLISTGIGIASGLAGGYASQLMPTNVVASPVLDGAIKGAAGGTAGGFVGGGLGSVANGENFFDGAVEGTWKGAGTGAIVGGSVKGLDARSKGYNPWNGKNMNPTPTHSVQGKGVSPQMARVSNKGIQGGKITNPAPSRINGSLEGYRLGQGDFAGKKITTRNLYLNPGKQGRHVIGHPKYQAGKSILSANPQRLVNDLNSGNFTPVGVTKGGIPIVKFNYNIGTAINLSGNQGLTAYGAVHVGRGGIHVVPIPFP